MAGPAEPLNMDVTEFAGFEREVRSRLHATAATMNLPLTLSSRWSVVASANAVRISAQLGTQGDVTMADLSESSTVATVESLTAETEQLRRALASRDVIGTAKGIIMSSLGCSPDDAFTILSRQSQTEKRKLHVIAQEIVDGATRRGRISAS
jgi:hypothetical protein